jgi:hypothetical protein
MGHPHFSADTGWRTETSSSLADRLAVRGLHSLSQGLVTQIMFGSKPGLGLVQIIAINHYVEHFGFFQAILFSQRKSYL